ncbi:MAG: 16S rRNA (uracil(1498)-N(3))-methyltransferase [Ignavibacteria bacterium]|nr:16S rRNA (uracil(1498)-N(3))-methyltransferase [Ignavibacteria bacterium]MBI3766207.1 16S rRNA (uracil(1498)-N(3))-methyltransferase [Ignavibacteriales bacterium]
MDYFYCSPEKIIESTLEIDGEEFSHLVHVMRKKEGDEIRVVDGRGTAYDVCLDLIKKKTARGTIHATYAHHHELPFDVTLAVGILKNPSKFDFLVEKVTELGVKEIIPLQTDRTIPSHAKADRWKKLALSAMKQSGRSVLPRVSELTTLEEFIREAGSFDVKLIAHERSVDAHAGLTMVQSNARAVAILVGPEGGFSDDEVERCVAIGWTPVFLGERRFRTETAAIVMTALTVFLQSR